MPSALKKLRRVATVLVAAGATTALIGIPTAHAAPDYCGDNKPTSNPTVFMRACMIQRPDTLEWIPGAKFRIPYTLDPAKWSACTVRVAVFQKSATASSWTRKQTGVGNCLPSFQAYSTQNRAWLEGDIPQAFFPSPKVCYYSLTRWYGTYNGQPVSSPVSQSLTMCGSETGGLELGVANDGTTLPETPELPTVTSIPLLEE